MTPRPIALLAVPLLAVATVACAPQPGDDLPGPLRDQLAARAVELLEHDPTFRTEVTREPGWHPVCVATVFGAAPPDAETVAQVETIYTWANCTWLPPADRAATTSLDDLPGEAVPVALRPGPPVTYQVPGDGADHEPDIRRIFPARLRDAAFTGPDQAAEERLQERLREQANASPQPSPS
ncbi:hypothetical protein [Micromonospora auratinigra]|uniref:Lipoprotein n=1 Tax=Micromonospora auratinigra TaxID=261654 RepID=A0A1A8ZAR1_9ACTN|nr:hypothetical protein [Micromonospora auratinigra]SBT40954.1 hypothetical protein GA0070611_1445 [Micromonospora auratinigra]